MNRRCAVRMFLAGSLLVCYYGAAAQSYPNKPIRIVTSEPGASADLATRIVAQGLSAGFGHQVIVENRGGNVIIPAGIVIKAPADGYTLYGATSATWIAPVLDEQPRYDPVQDFSPISLTTSSPSVLSVHPSVAATTLKELIALAKAKPGEINIGFGVRGSTTHLAAELFKTAAGVNMLGVPYKGAAPATNAAVANQVQVIAVSASSTMPHVKAGRLRALVVASSRPSALAPGVPTSTAAGLPGYESEVVNGILAPAKLPQAIIQKLHGEMYQYLTRPDIKEKVFGLGLDVVASTPEEFAAKIKLEMARISKLAKESRLRGD